jgi:hypothetical protein
MKSYYLIFDFLTFIFDHSYYLKYVKIKKIKYNMVSYIMYFKYIYLRFFVFLKDFK